MVTFLNPLLAALANSEVESFFWTGTVPCAWGSDNWPSPSGSITSFNKSNCSWRFLSSSLAAFASSIFPSLLRLITSVFFALMLFNNSKSFLFLIASLS